MAQRIKLAEMIGGSNCFCGCISPLYPLGAILLDIHRFAASPLLALHGGWGAGGMNTHPSNMASNSLPPSSSKKHKRNLSDSEDEPQNNSSWPRYLVVQSTTEQPLKINPFVVAKAVQGIAGEVTSAKRLRSGSYLIQCANRQQSVNLLAAKTFGEVPVKVEPHRTLNSSKGILRDRDRIMTDMSESDIASELKSQNVTHVKRFSIKKDGRIIKINTYLLTFSTPTPPKGIKAGFCSVPVEKYIPNPLRCYKCQRYGHGSSSCKGQPICVRCADKHNDTECNKAIKCANCSGDHMASSKSCPIWQQEAEILKLKVNNNISFAEAKKIVIQNKTSSSYAAAASSKNMSDPVCCGTCSCKKPKSVTIACQTYDSCLSSNISKTVTASKPAAKKSSPSRQASSSSSRSKAIPSSSSQSKTIPSSSSGALKTKAPAEKKTQNNFTSSQDILTDRIPEHIRNPIPMDDNPFEALGESMEYDSSSSEDVEFQISQGRRPVATNKLEKSRGTDPDGWDVQLTRRQRKQINKQAVHTSTSSGVKSTDRSRSVPPSTESRGPSPIRPPIK